MGIPAGLVALLALFRWRAVLAFVPAAIWSWLALGYWAPVSLFGGMRQLPLFSQLRNPERFLVPLGLVIALAAAWAVSDWSVRLARPERRSRWVALVWSFAVVGLVVNVPFQVVNFIRAAGARTLGPVPVEEARPFHQARGNRWSAAVWAPMSRGSLSCWEAYPLRQSGALRGDLVHEAWLGDPSAGALQEREWSPNRLELQVSLTKPTRALINQNYHPGWRTSVGKVVDAQGLLAVELPPGEHQVTLRFLPRAALGGLLVSGLSVVAALLLLWRARQWQRRGVLVAALVLVPLLAGAVVALAIDEQRAPIKLEGPEGEALVADAPPEGAVRYDARFGGGVWLRAVKIDEDREAGKFRLELDWETTLTLEPGLGFFVHIEPGVDKRINADHAQISGQLLLEDAPKGKILRDILIIEAPSVRRNQDWNVWVGLWSLRGDGARKAVLEPAGHKVDSQRLHVGTIFGEQK